MAGENAELLLVEDNPQDAELTLRALRKRRIGDGICHVRDGAAALDYLYRRGVYAMREPDRIPKVILLDLKLPKVSGLEVLRIIKGDERLRRLPVVIVTSSREDPDVQSAYRLGANSYVVKPVGFDAFMTAMTEVGSFWLQVNEVHR